MITIFLSYATKDHYFADLAGIKLGEENIHLWRDKGELLAGNDWRNGIEQGISNSRAVLVALSKHSAESSYVTYEWAYAMGKGKPIIPLKLEDCIIHPKLETIQYLDFSIPGALPWESLIERIKEIEIGQDVKSEKEQESQSVITDTRAKQILAYLNQRGYTMASFERLRKRIDGSITDDQFKTIIKQNNTVFRSARLKGGKAGLAKLVP